jgi:hypothetical protein
MSVTQVYKKRTCCDQNCQQGRTCPRSEESALFTSNLAAAVVSCFFIVCPLLLWALDIRA